MGKNKIYCKILILAVQIAKLRKITAINTAKIGKK